MEVSEKARVNLLDAPFHGPLETEPLEFARDELVGAHEGVRRALLPILGQRASVGSLAAVQARVLVLFVVVRLNGVVDHIDVDNLPLGQQLGGEVEGVLRRTFVVGYMHGLDGDVETVLHVVRVGEDRLVVRVAIPRMLVYFQRTLGRQGADHARNLAAQVVDLVRVLALSVRGIVTRFVLQHLHALPSSRLAFTHLGDGVQLPHAILLQREGQNDSILLDQHGRVFFCRFTLRLPVSADNYYRPEAKRNYP